MRWLILALLAALLGIWWNRYEARMAGWHDMEGI